METINQEQTPTLSTVEQQKEVAGEFVANRIEDMKQERNIGTLEAAKLVYEEVKGQNYREEQAAAKLLEFLNLQNELDLREKEIKSMSSSLGRYTNATITNDEKYLVSA